MSLYWKNQEIRPGMVMDVDFIRPEQFDSNGRPTAIRWQVIGFGNRMKDEAYLDPLRGKKYPLKKVLKSLRLQARLKRKELLQLPAGTDFIIVQEYHNGEEASMRCYALDMMGIVRDLRIIQ